MADIDCAAEGLTAAKTRLSADAAGWFHAGHRALSDTLAGLFMLTLPLPVSGTLPLAALLDSARRPLVEVRARRSIAYQRSRHAAIGGIAVMAGGPKGVANLDA